MAWRESAASNRTPPIASTRIAMTAWDRGHSTARRRLDTLRGNG